MARCRLVGRMVKADGSRAAAEVLFEPVDLGEAASVSRGVVRVPVDANGRWRVSLEAGTYVVRAGKDIWRVVVPAGGQLAFEDLAERVG